LIPTFWFHRVERDVFEVFELTHHPTAFSTRGDGSISACPV
jgi:hypothetical protein